MAILQFQHRLPFVQPMRLSLALLSPGVAEINGVTDKLGSRVILRNDIFQLRQTAVHLHRNALCQRFRLQRIQRQKQFIRVSHIHVLSCVRKPNPHAIHIVPARQFYADAIAAFIGKRLIVHIRKRIIKGSDSDEMSVTKGVFTLTAVRLSHLARINIFPRLRSWALDLIHNEVSQSGIISGSIEKSVVIQFVCEQHRRVGRLWVLYLHGPPKQQAFFCSHVFEPALQPIMLRFCHFETIQQSEEL